jgi:hypothetical protein
MIDDEYYPPAPRNPAHGGIIRVLPGCPRLHCESGRLRSPRSRRDRLVWLVYLIPPPRLARILPFKPRHPGDLT